MTTIAKKKPSDFRTPVYVTESIYEVWYCQPRSLGKIERRGAYWFTEDGMRFPASRDAMNYLVRLEGLMARPSAVASSVSTETRRELADRVISKQELAEKVIQKHAPAPKTVTPKGITPKAVAAKAGATSATTEPINQSHPRFREGEGLPANQNHPAFQEFLDFIEFMGHRKASRLDKVGA